MTDLHLVKRIDDESEVVAKLLFDKRGKDGGTVTIETVLYKYEDRVVVCFSTQFGCPVGCKFCGTGNKFGEDLTANDMRVQILTALSEIEGYDITKKDDKDNYYGLKGKKVQLMPMSMGEPMLNWKPTHVIAHQFLKKGFYFFVSTVGINNKFVLSEILQLGYLYPKFGLQFSLHNPYNFNRMQIFRNNTLNYMTVTQITEIADMFYAVSGNPAYFNYIVTGKEDSMVGVRLGLVVGTGHLTCSVLCSTTKMVHGDTDKVYKFMDMMNEFCPGINMSMFDPAGQDTIGGGCGQLLYTQENLNKYGNNNTTM